MILQELLGPEWENKIHRILLKSLSPSAKARQNLALAFSVCFVLVSPKIVLATGFFCCCCCCVLMGISPAGELILCECKEFYLIAPFLCLACDFNGCLCTEGSGSWAAEPLALAFLLANEKKLTVSTITAREGISAVAPGLKAPPPAEMSTASLVEKGKWKRRRKEGRKRREQERRSLAEAGAHACLIERIG